MPAAIRECAELPAGIFQDGRGIFRGATGTSPPGAPDSAQERPVRRLLIGEHMTDMLQARVRGEYREMPGLRLTLSQAARLFNIECTQCEQVLNTLVTDGALWTNGHEFFGPKSSRRSA